MSSSIEIKELISNCCLTKVKEIDFKWNVTPFVSWDSKKTLQFNIYINMYFYTVNMYNAIADHLKNLSL